MKINEDKIGVSLINYFDESRTSKIAIKFSKISIVDKIVIIDNGSSCKFDDEIYLNDKIDILKNNDNIGYSRANNQAIKLLINKFKCKYIIISNSDVEFNDEIVERLKSFLNKNIQYGIVAPHMKDNEGNDVALRYIDLSIKRLFLRIIIKDLDKVYEQKHENKKSIIDQNMIPGSFFMARSDALVKCGYFDENVFLYREEEILGARMKRCGYKMCVLNDISYYHLHKYKSEKIKNKVKSLVISMHSEYYYFKKYSHYNILELITVRLLQYIYILREIIKYLLQGMLRRI